MLSWWSLSIKMIPLQSKYKITECVIPMSFDVRSHPLKHGSTLKVAMSIDSASTRPRSLWNLTKYSRVLRVKQTPKHLIKPCQTLG